MPAKRAATKKSAVKPYRLYGGPGWGSAITEAMLEVAGLPTKLEDNPNWTEGAAAKKLAKINPLVQLPTLVLPDGQIMTESAAIALLLAERAPKSGLVIPAGDKRRAQFLRWLAFVVAAIYPTFTYGDDPSRFVSGDAVEELRDSTNEQRKKLWRMVEKQVSQPFWMGKEFTALDIYVLVMSRWRPGMDWFRAECPKLAGIAERAYAHPAIAKTVARHYKR